MFASEINTEKFRTMKSDIILAGVGGQGILSIANVLGIAALEENLFLKQAEVHGMSQRGGDVHSDLRISSNPIHSDLIPLASADLIVSLEPMEALRYLPYLSSNGRIVTNTAPFVNIDNYPELDKIEAMLAALPNVVSFDMEAVAKELGSPRSSNMVLLGAASRFIEINAQRIEDAIRTFFARKGPKITENNLAAFKVGREYLI